MEKKPLKKLLLEILDDLTIKEVKKFAWYLVQDVVEGLEPIPRSKLENADRMDIVDQMIKRFGVKDASKITLQILREMNRNDLVESMYLSQVELQQHEGVVGPVETTRPEQQDVVTKMLEMLEPFEKPEDKLWIIDKLKKDLNLNNVSQYEINMPRGICLIINNEYFYPEYLKDRDGSDVDAESLARVFSWLGFWVVMCTDKKAQEMRDVLKLFAELNSQSLPKLQKSEVLEWAGERRKFVELQQNKSGKDGDPSLNHGDAFVCCIMSHGADSGIYGADGEILEHSELLAFFNGSNCSALIKKPKLFFIQVCRIEPQKQPGYKPNPGPSNAKKAKTESKLLYNVTDDSDMLIAWATVDKQISIRSKKGSWFVQSLCYQLTRGCPRGEDIVLILTDVTGQVGDKEGPMIINNKEMIAKQLPEVKSRLGKRLILPVPL